MTNSDERWRRMHPDDPATVAGSDQIIAGAVDRIRHATSFLALTIDNHEAVEVSAIIEPEATSADSENLLRMLAYTLVRLWFDDLENDDELTQALMIHTFIQNMTSTIAIVLREQGIVD